MGRREMGRIFIETLGFIMSWGEKKASIKRSERYWREDRRRRWTQLMIKMYNGSRRGKFSLSLVFSFYGKSIFLPSHTLDKAIPSRDSVVDIKKGGKIQIWKNMCSIKVYGRTILFCVHVSLLSEMDTWTRRRCKQNGLSSSSRSNLWRKRFFLGFIDFRRE